LPLLSQILPDERREPLKVIFLSPLVTAMLDWLAPRVVVSFEPVLLVKDKFIDAALGSKVSESQIS
jgi:hypothetical protein